MQGNCTFGDRCRYSHDVGNIGQAVQGDPNLFVPNAEDIDMLYDDDDYFDSDNTKAGRQANSQILLTDEETNNDDNRTTNNPILVADEMWNKIDIEVKEHEGQGAYEVTCVPYDYDDI